MNRIQTNIATDLVNRPWWIAMGLPTSIDLDDEETGDKLLALLRHMIEDRYNAEPSYDPTRHEFERWDVTLHPRQRMSAVAMPAEKHGASLGEACARHLGYWRWETQAEQQARHDEGITAYFAMIRNPRPMGWLSE